MATPKCKGNREGVQREGKCSLEERILGKDSDLSSCVLNLVPKLVIVNWKERLCQFIWI